MRDLVLGIFAILEHTPVSAFGLNSRQHFEINSEKIWHAIGDHFAPKESWTELFDPEPRLGMRSLAIQGNVSKTLADRIQITVEPSLAALPYGVYININQHYREAKDNDKPGDVEKMLQVLSNLWEDFLSYRGTVAKHIFSEVSV